MELKQSHLLQTLIIPRLSRSALIYVLECIFNEVLTRLKFHADGSRV